MKKVFLVFVAVCGFIFPGCAQRYSDAGDFQIEVSDNGDSIRIIGYIGEESNVKIPGRIDDLPVIAIWNEAFLQKELTGVTIPNTVTHIGDYAFSMNKFTKINIPNSVTYIGDAAFSHCQLTSITIPNSVTHIGNGAFTGNLFTGVTIPNSVTYMGSAVFRVNENLKTINVSANNPNFSSVDGVLYNKDHTVLLQWPQAKPGAAIIPDDVSHIGNLAFFLNQLNNITIPDSVTHIGEGAFAFNQFTSITIPNSVTSIEARAFWNNQLIDVTIPSFTDVEPNAFDSEVAITRR